MRTKIAAWTKEVRMVLPHNIKQVFINLDQMVHIIFFMMIEPREKHYGDETISSHFWRWHVAGKRSWPHKVVDWVALHFFNDPNHCEESYKAEILRLQSPPESRSPGAIDD